MAIKYIRLFVCGNTTWCFHKQKVPWKCHPTSSYNIPFKGVASLDCLLLVGTVPADASVALNVVPDLRFTWLTMCNIPRFTADVEPNRHPDDLDPFIT
jgi:hypothetical protein